MLISGPSEIYHPNGQVPQVWHNADFRVNDSWIQDVQEIVLYRKFANGTEQRLIQVSMADLTRSYLYSPPQPSSPGITYLVTSFTISQNLSMTSCSFQSPYLKIDEGYHGIEMSEDIYDAEGLYVYETVYEDHAVNRTFDLKIRVSTKIKFLSVNDNQMFLSRHYLMSLLWD